MSNSLGVSDYERFFRTDRAGRTAFLGPGGAWLRDADCVVNGGPAPHWGAGEYAIVGKFRADDGSTFAFRGPLKPFSQDVVARDRAIAAHVAGLPSRPKCLVDNGFHERAVQVAGEWVDAYRMEWVEGTLLGDAVEQLCAAGDRAALTDLANRWESLLLELESCRIAHGDLQHDNVMVRPDGSLALLDYDTMFVPALAGTQAPALGLRGYAHPAVLAGAIGRPYDLTIDTFPGLVILLSLRALAADPDLKKSDPCFRTQNLLLKDKQLASGSTDAFRLMGGLNDPVVPGLAMSIGSMCDDATLSFVPASTVLSGGFGAYAPRRKAPSSAGGSSAPEAYVPRGRSTAQTHVSSAPYLPKGRGGSPANTPPAYVPRNRDREETP